MAAAAQSAIQSDHQSWCAHIVENEVQRTFRGCMLSTGEESAAAIASDVGRARSRGEEARWIDIPVGDGPLGIVDRLGDAGQDETQAAAAMVADALNETACKSYGTAGPEFVKHIVADIPGTEERVNDLVKRFLDKADVPKSGWECRIGKKFALVYAAGILAIEFGVLPYDPKVMRQVVVATYRSARSLLIPPVDPVSQAWLDLRALLSPDNICDLTKRGKRLPTIAVINDAQVILQRKGDKRRVLVATEAFDSLADVGTRQNLLAQLSDCKLLWQTSDPKKAQAQMFPAKGARRRYFLCLNEGILTIGTDA